MYEPSLLMYTLEKLNEYQDQEETPEKNQSIRKLISIIQALINANAKIWIDGLTLDKQPLLYALQNLDEGTVRFLLSRNPQAINKILKTKADQPITIFDHFETFYAKEIAGATEEEKKEIQEARDEMKQLLRSLGAKKFEELQQKQ